MKDIILEKCVFNLYQYNSSIHPDFTELEKKYLRVSKETAFSILFKDGSVPQWINIFVSNIDRDKTVISIKYSNKFFENNEELDFYGIEPTSPFKIGGPYKTAKIDNKEKFFMEPFDEEKGEIVG